MSFIEPKSKDSSITSISFNQNSTCLVIGIDKGFKIFSTQPFREHIERSVDAELVKIEMYQRSNLISFVSNESSVKFGSNKVIIWDDYQAKVLLELRLNEKVVNVKMKKDYIFVVTELQVQIFNFAAMTAVESFPTFKNSIGAFGISYDKDVSIIAFPDSSEGYITVKDLKQKFSALIAAHDHKINSITISYKGEFIATSSVIGTVIRIFDPKTGKLLQNLRRGSEAALIYSISFSFDCKYLSCSSSNPTVHVFSLRSAYFKKYGSTFMQSSEYAEGTYNTLKEPKNKIVIEEESEFYKLLPKNQKSVFNNLSGLIPLPSYFNCEWSFAQLRFKELTCPLYVSFSLDCTLYIFCADGKFMHVKFDSEKGGDCDIIFENNIFFKS